MTEVIEYQCKSCNRKFGPLGMHGAAVELLVACTKCKDIFVASVKDGKLVKTSCVRCGSKYKIFDCKCPACGSEKMYYRDLALGLPGDLWMECRRKR